MLTPKIEKKLFLLDSFALIYRAYYAFIKAPRINSKGINTSAAFGFTNALLDIINNEQPTHIAVVFDAPGGPTNRIEQFEQYKAQREAMPEDIRNMIDPIKEIVKALNIPILMKTGYEADDVIGTLAKIAETQGYVTYMMTPDKDFGQLVTEKSLIYKPGRGGKPASIMGIPEVLEKFEVERTDQVIDILGLWGDASDNIPGIPGIGEKTAKELIQKYGSMEAIFEHLDDFKGKRKENLTNFKEQGLLSKQLATIITDVDVPFIPEELKIGEPNKEQLIAILTELEFKGIAKRILGEEIVVTATQSPVGSGQLDLFGTPQDAPQELTKEPEVITELKTVESEKPNYHFIDSEEGRKQLIQTLLQQKSVCFDTETDNLESRNADLVGMAFSYQEKEGFYIPFTNDFEQTKKIVQEFSPIFESTSIEKIAHNIKYDEQVINRYGVTIQGPRFDTMIAHYLLTPDGRHNMDLLAEYYLHYKTIHIESLIGKRGKDQKTMWEADQKLICTYCCEDTDITLQLKNLFEPEIQKEYVKDLFYKIEMPLTEVLKSMEQEGVQLDIARLNEFSKELDVSIKDLEEKITGLAGMEFNLDSPKQLGEVLFEVLQISKKAKKTKTGQYSTSEDTLQAHINDHPIIPLILDYRSLRKLKSTYVDPLPDLVDDTSGRLHTHFMQTVTATGRLSSTNPNLQNIPIRTEKGREIRKAFIARNDDYYFMSADYSQIELRIIAALSGDKNMIEAFKNKQDIHASTAAKVYGIADIKDVTKEQRSNAKAVNFGIIYGQSAFGLSQNLGISRGEAKTIIDNYFAQYPTIVKYISDVKEKAKELGYVETIMGRRRYLPDIHSTNAIVRGFAERNAINAPIQGSAADIIKIAMIHIYKRFQEEKLVSKMILQIHDELIFDVLKTEKDIVEKIVREEMEGAVQLVVPLDIEMEFAENWLAAH
ncbi:MAG: DNA polymerase I [Brumimicrobium sp.]|nr:DNA polymerase I [Brumimicrobium sp.]